MVRVLDSVKDRRARLAQVAVFVEKDGSTKRLTPDVDEVRPFHSLTATFESARTALVFLLRSKPTCTEHMKAPSLFHSRRPPLTQ